MAAEIELIQVVQIPHQGLFEMFLAKHGHLKAVSSLGRYPRRSIGKGYR